MKSGLRFWKNALKASFASGAREPRGEHLSFDADRLQHLVGVGAAHQLLRLAHRAGRQRVEALGDAPRMVHHFAGRQHRIGDAEFDRVLRAERLAEQELLSRFRAPDELRQYQARGELRHEAEAHERHRQARFVGQVDEVAMQQHRGADADRRAGDRSHHRLVACRSAPA